VRGGRPQPQHQQAQFWAGIIPPVAAHVKVPSYPMQDEPEGEVRFQHKMSPAQVTRLIARYRKSRSLQAAPYRRHRFPQRYTRADIELLATVDEAHENLSGPATRRILEREYRQYGKPEYERLSTISVAHLYNLRQLLTACACSSRIPPQEALRISRVHGGPQGTIYRTAWSFWESEVDLERERMENQPLVLKQIESGVVKVIEGTVECYCTNREPKTCQRNVIAKTENH
jgi:hypothetical protein